MLALALVLLAAHSVVQGNVKEAFVAQRNEVWLEYAGRHLELAAWCRDKGLVREAKHEITLAEELADGRHAGVEMTLAAMKRFGDAYWNTRSRPSESTAKSYAKKAEDLRRKEQSARVELADRAHDLGLAEDALAEYESAMRLRDKAFELDAEGRIVIESGPLPPDVSQRLRAEAIEINGRPWMRDEIQRQVPSMKSLWEVESDRLRVRSTGSAEIARSLHALASALVSILEGDFGARPPKRLDLLVVETRADYEAWLRAAGLEKYAAAQGFADSESDTAVLLHEGLGESWLQGLLLHELTHLFDLGLAHTGMPDWYREGLAEQYGAAGSFHWDAATQELVVGGKLLEGDLANLRASPGTVEEILEFDALAAWSQGQESGRAGYARAWALVRYLSTTAPPKIRERFLAWQKQCHAEGAASSKRTRDASAATLRFRGLLGGSMAELEEGYAAFVAGL
jgi:hypothetical protein